MTRAARPVITPRDVARLLGHRLPQDDGTEPTTATNSARQPPALPRPQSQPYEAAGAPQDALEPMSEDELTPTVGSPESVGAQLERIALPAPPSSTEAGDSVIEAVNVRPSSSTGAKLSPR